MRKTNSSAVRRISDLSIAVGSDIGSVRNENQDRVAIVRGASGNGLPLIFGVVCDGMGGMVDGALCASIVMATFITSCYHNTDLPPKDRLFRAVMDANRTVYNQYNGTGGSTISAFLLEGGQEFWAVNVGDSRIYSLTKSLNQLTVDDTLAGQREDNASENEHLRSNELLQFVGMGQDLQPHIINLSLTSNVIEQLFILTSDGVHFLPREIIQSILTFAHEPAVAVRRLIDLSKWCGGRDNATAIVFSLDKLLDQEIKANIVEVWDAFGELQIFSELLIKVDENLSLKCSPTLPKERLPGQQESELDQKTIKQIKRNVRKSPTSKTKRAKQKNLDLDVNDISPDDNNNTIPKLIIEFKKTSEN